METPLEKFAPSAEQAGGRPLTDAPHFSSLLRYVLGLSCMPSVSYTVCL